VALDHGVDLGVEPARVPKLDRRRPRQVRKQQLQQLRVPLLRGRELEQDGAGAVAERLHPGPEIAGG
jgi:hypothetical protein